MVRIIKRAAVYMLCFTLAASAFACTVQAAAESGADTNITQEQQPRQGRGGGRPEGGQRPPGGGRMGGNMQPPQIPNDGGLYGDTAQSQQAADGNAAAGGEMPDNGGTAGEPNGIPPFGGGMQNRRGFPSMQGNTQNMGETVIQEEASGNVLDFMKEYSAPIISVILLGFAFIFVIFYKRKTY